MYRSQCCDTIQLSADEIPNIDRSIFKKLIEDIFNGNAPDKKAVLKETFNVFSKGVSKGFKVGFNDIKYNSPDFRMLNELHYNVGVFSAFKNHRQITEMVQLLHNSDGTLKKWDVFKVEALKLDKTYNVNWLKTEYHQAISSARSAREWQDIQRTKHLYPNLMYLSVNDDRTRKMHKAWHGIILPVDHPFWDTHYPINDHGCRCSTKRSDKPVDDKGIEVDKMPKLPLQFNQNVGKTGKVFDKSHPYFDIPQYKEVFFGAKKALIKFTETNIKKTIRGKILNSGIKGDFDISNAGIEKTININRSSDDSYHILQLLYKIKEIVKDVDFKYEAVHKKVNQGILGFYKGSLVIQNVKYEIAIKKTSSGNKFHYIAKKSK
jgi:SPP1 gp7 family putative phage head morphogenesis protein